MSKIVLYKSFLERYPWLEDEYEKISKKLPCVLIRSFEGFIDDLSNKHIFVPRDEFVLKAAQILDTLKEELFIQKMNMYLYVMFGNGGESDKIQDYYKVWKWLKKEKYDINNFHLGYEYKTKIDNSVVYAGNAKFEFRDIDKALKILYDNEYKSFIYITADNTLTEDDKVKELYDMLLNESIEKIGHDKFDFSNLYENMHLNNSIIKMATGGEEFCMDIIQRQEALFSLNL